MEKFETAIREILESYQYEENVEKVLAKIRSYEKFVIFGAGQLGHKIYNILNEQGERAFAFCDNQLCGNVDGDTGLEIVGLKELDEDKKETFVLIAVFDDGAYDVVYRQLLEFGFEEKQMTRGKNMAERYPLSFLKRNLEKYRQVYAFLEDEFSKEVYINMIQKAYLDADISRIVSEEQEAYFDQEVSLSENEVFIDCGGYIGDTALQFVNRCKGHYKKLIIFEPEACKETIIRENLKGYAYDLYQCGVWSSSGALRFSARGDSASYIAENGQMEIPVKALDDVVLKDCPTFIKMDIEGAEIEALKGSRRIIEECRPKLAICIYHRPEDLFEIPLLIREMRKDYRLLVRQYSSSRFETVCYAI